MLATQKDNVRAILADMRAKIANTRELTDQVKANRRNCSSAILLRALRMGIPNDKDANHPRRAPRTDRPDAAHLLLRYERREQDLVCTRHGQSDPAAARSFTRPTGLLRADEHLARSGP